MDRAWRLRRQNEADRLQITNSPPCGFFGDGDDAPPFSAYRDLDEDRRHAPVPAIFSTSRGRSMMRLI